MDTTHTKKGKESESKMLQQGEGNTSIEMIKERMKQKRRKKALNDSNTSWSRSRSKKKGGTNASFLLKSSLHSNNQALAKALSTSKHEVHQANQIILDYQKERQYLIQQANMRRPSEKECLNRFHNIKLVLTKVTTSLGDAVTSLSQALDLCSSLPIRESSLGIGRCSITSDDDSFNILPKTDNGLTLCRKADIMSKVIESTSSDLMQAVDSMAVATNHLKTQSHDGNETSHLDLEVTMTEHDDVPLMFTDEPWLKDVDGSESPPYKPPMKRSRTATLLDPVAIKKALTEPTIHDEGSNEHVNQPNQPQTAESSLNPPNLPKAATQSPATQKQASKNEQSSVRSSESTPVKSKQIITEDTEVNKLFQPIIPNKDRYVFVHSPCKVTNNSAVDMELTDCAANSAVSSPRDNQSKTQDNRSFINHDDRVIRPWGNIQLDDPSVNTKTTSTKSSMKTTESSSKNKPPKAKKGSKNKSSSSQSSKQMKKDAKKAFAKSKKKTSWMSDSFKNDLAVFDLSAGDSFSLPPPQLQQMTSKLCDTIIASKKEQCVKEPLSNEVLLLKDSDSKKAKIFPDNEVKSKDEKEATEAHSITSTDPIHHVHSEPKVKASKLQRKSKKAKSVVTPCVDQAAQARSRAKLTAITSPVENEELDIFDGTYQFDQPHTETTAALKKHSGSSQDPGKTKPENHLSTKDKHKTKTGNNKMTIQKDSVQPISNKDSSSSKIPLPSLTKDHSKPSKTKTIIPSDEGHDPSDLQDDLGKGQSVRVKGDLKKSSHKASRNAALQQPSVAVCLDDVSHQPARGMKRSVDEENKIEVDDEENKIEIDYEETGRKSRRTAPVCYKEPSLNTKMRQQHSPDRAKKKKVTKKGQGIKRTALGTVTNVM
ncbi:uncharacterized protein [Asterias amurensis]|uniref:uncharacterized protein n=1 Tax=Asterias amurensis TaxID=7602 RepID=UPI003AB5E5E9